MYGNAQTAAGGRATVLGCSNLAKRYGVDFTRGQKLSDTGSIVIQTSVPIQLKSQPNQARSLIDQADFSESDLLARLSHEMRTPLSAILGFAQLMESCTPNPTVSQKRSIDLILQAGWHLDKLLDMTRDFSLLQSGILALSLEPVALATVMLECKAAVESQAKMRGVRLAFPLIEQPCFVLADRIRLQQVLGYFLSAAIDNSEVDGALHVDCDTRGLDYIRIGISDGGSESSAGRRKSMNEARGGLANEASDTRGIGIGLLLAKRLVESMGGGIGTQDTVGKRSIFSFDLKRTSETTTVNAIAG